MVQLKLLAVMTVITKASFRTKERAAYSPRHSKARRGRPSRAGTSSPRMIAPSIPI
jgi:hypothetical protein